MTVPVDTTLEAVVRRDRLVVVTVLTAVIALSWAYLLAGTGMGMSAFEDDPHVAARDDRVKISPTALYFSGPRWVSYAVLH